VGDTMESFCGNGFDIFFTNVYCIYGWEKISKRWAHIRGIERLKINKILFSMEDKKFILYGKV